METRDTPDLEVRATMAAAASGVFTFIRLSALATSRLLPIAFRDSVGMLAAMRWLERIWMQLGVDRVLPFIRKLLIAVIGSTVLLIGLLLLFLPGPGLLIILLGLGILAVEFVWARRLVERGRLWVQGMTRRNKEPDRQ